MRRLAAWLLLLTGVALTGCASAPTDGVPVVSQFDYARFAGHWFEIARLPHPFERGITDAGVNFGVQPDGSLKVVSRGFDVNSGAWRETVGRGQFVGQPTIASMRVSLFGEPTLVYRVVELDRARYRWAMVLGPDRRFLWILSRDRALPSAVVELLLRRATLLGVNVDDLIWVTHNRGEAADTEPIPLR